MFSNQAAESEARDRAMDRLRSRAEIGIEEQNKAIKEAMRMHIEDKLVAPSSCFFVHDNANHLAIEYKDGNRVKIHNHALGQLASTASIPRRYVSSLRDGCVGMSPRDRHDLLCHVFNAHYTKGEYLDRSRRPARFLHRVVNQELRGFLSRNFNRRIGTVAMLRPFVAECQEQQAAPVSTIITPVKMTVKCYLPYIFEPLPNEFISFGVCYSNSDFGAGRLTVSSAIMRVSSGSSTVLNDELSMVHLGALITDEEINMSEDTLKKESATHISAVRDMVKSALSEENVEKTLKLVIYASDKKISLASLREKLRDVLQKSDLEDIDRLLKQADSGISDLPPVNDDGGSNPSLWWASSAVSWLANSATDPERKSALQLAAGRLLEVKK